jgi:small basic protein
MNSFVVMSRLQVVNEIAALVVGILFALLTRTDPDVITYLAGRPAWQANTLFIGSWTVAVLAGFSALVGFESHSLDEDEDRKHFVATLIFEVLTVIALLTVLVTFQLSEIKETIFRGEVWLWLWLLIVLYSLFIVSFRVVILRRFG